MNIINQQQHELHEFAQMFIVLIWFEKSILQTN